MLTRASLAVETKDLLFLWLAHFNNKSNVHKQISSLLSNKVISSYVLIDPFYHFFFNQVYPYDYYLIMNIISVSLNETTIKFKVSMYMS